MDAGQHKVIMPEKKAFTLIELLVVIAIIALLVAILMPSLAKAREMARQTACLSNLKNLGSAFQLYASEYGALPYNAYGAVGAPGSLKTITNNYSSNYYGEFLEFVNGGNLPKWPSARSGNVTSWWAVTQSMLSLCQCPSDFGVDLFDIAIGSRPDRLTVSYAENNVRYTYDPVSPHVNTIWWPYARVNAVIRSRIIQFAVDAPAKIDQIPYPANTLELMEAMNWLMGPNYTLAKANGTSGSLYVRHPNMTSSFVDGHSEAKPKGAYTYGQLWGVDTPQSSFPSDDVGR